MAFALGDERHDGDGREAANVVETASATHENVANVAYLAILFMELCVNANGLALCRIREKYTAFGFRSQKYVHFIF